MSGANDDLARAVDQVLEGIEKRWQAGDGDGLADYFHPDADFVDVLGRIFRGRAAIARIHRKNFATIHLDSRARLERLRTHELAPGVALAHVKGSMSVPAGPLAGDSTATQTMVLVSDGGTWRIRAFHNTFVRQMPGIPEADDQAD
jgi:uncharacterized protein (TIGR02246 family)